MVKAGMEAPEPMTTDDFVPGGERREKKPGGKRRLTDEEAMHALASGFGFA